MRHIYNSLHHRGNLFGHFHRDHSRLFRRILDHPAALGFFLLRFLREFKGGKHTVVRFAIAVYIPDQPFTNDGCLRRDCPHLAFHIGIFLLTDRQVCHHLGKCRRNSPVQSRDTSAPRNRRATRRFGKKSFDCQIYKHCVYYLRLNILSSSRQTI